MARIGVPRELVGDSCRVTETRTKAVLVDDGLNERRMLVGIELDPVGK